MKKNKILQNFFLIISIILIIYTFYRSEIVWSGSKRAYYSTYYFISIIFFLTAVIVNFLSDEFKKYITIFFFSTLISLYLFEILKTYQKFKYSDVNSFDASLKIKQKRYFEKTGKQFDIRSKFEIYKDLKKENNNIVVPIYPALAYLNKTGLNLFPLGGISNSRTIHCNENGYYSIYDSDRYGFNNPDDEWDSESIKYFLVGDSFTHGDCVNRPNDIASILRKNSNANALNLGYGSNGPLIEYASIREYLMTNVENIVWIYYEINDNQNLINELKNQILFKYLKDNNYSQNLKEKQNQIDIIVKNELETNLINYENFIKTKKNNKNFISKKNIIKFLKLWETRETLNQFLPQKNKPNYSIHPEFENIIKLTKEIAINNNSNFYLVYLPRYQIPKPKINQDHFSKIKLITEKYNVPIINIYELVFNLDDDPISNYPFGLRGHFNVEGYKKIGKSIYDFIEKDQLLK